MDFMRRTITISKKAFEVGYRVAGLAAKSKQPYRVTDKLILQACKIIVKEMLDADAVKEVAKQTTQ